VADQETVKISDFGLARVGDGNDCYVMSSATNIPVKWEAIECLTHQKYSHKSDVWSFGVTLWEMFAYGETPSMAGCKDFFTSEERGRQDYKDWLRKLEEGVRLPRTDLCPEFLYSRVMLRCWLREPAARPSFLNLRQDLKQAELEAT
jgi:serine/threonine protein kinase